VTDPEIRYAERVADIDMHVADIDRKLHALDDARRHHALDALAGSRDAIKSIAAADAETD
jgi:hypothetical protein